MLEFKNTVIDIFKNIDEFINGLNMNKEEISKHEDGSIETS